MNCVICINMRLMARYYDQLGPMDPQSMSTTTMASPYLGSFPKWYFSVEKEITASALFSL